MDSGNLLPSLVHLTFGGEAIRARPGWAVAWNDRPPLAVVGAKEDSTMSQSSPSKVKVTVLARPFGTGSGVAENAEEAVALARRDLKRLYPESRPSAYRVGLLQGETYVPVVSETAFSSWETIAMRAARASESLENRAA